MSHAERDAARHRQKVFNGGLLILAGLSAATWILMNRMPMPDVCAFRDVWALRVLWPDNGFVLDQIKAYSYSERDQCVFFAVRSLESLYWAIATGLAVYGTRRLAFRLERLNPIFAFFMTGLMAWLLFFERFDIATSGRGAWFGLHSYDPVWWLFVKSIARMMLVYAYFFFLIAYLRNGASAAVVTREPPASPPASERSNDHQ